MIRRLAAPLLVVFVVACADLVGIRPLPSSTDDGGPTDAQIQFLDAASPSDPGVVCTNASTVIAPSIELDSLVVASGFVFAQFAGNGVTRCATNATCTQSTNIVTTASQGVVGGYGAAAILFYTLQSIKTGNGALRSASLDGSNDQVVVANVTYPTWTTAYGESAFWIDDPIAGGLTASATLHCVGCGTNTGDQAWITGLAQTYGLLRDVNDVYVLADDGSGASLGVFACGTSTPCNASPSTIVTGLDATTARSMIATDGFRLYVARSDHTDIERIDGSNQTIVVVPSPVAAVAIAADITTNELFYATDDAKIFTTTSDGSTQSILLTACNATAKITDLAFDPTTLYALLTLANGTSGVYAIKR